MPVGTFPRPGPGPVVVKKNVAQVQVRPGHIRVPAGVLPGSSGRPCRSIPAPGRPGRPETGPGRIRRRLRGGPGWRRCRGRRCRVRPGGPVRRGGGFRFRIRLGTVFGRGAGGGGGDCFMGAATARPGPCGRGMRGWGLRGGLWRTGRPTMPPAAASMAGRRSSHGTKDFRGAGLRGSPVARYRAARGLGGPAQGFADGTHGPGPRRAVDIPSTRPGRARKGAGRPRARPWGSVLPCGAGAVLRPPR